MANRTTAPRRLATSVDQPRDDRLLHRPDQRRANVGARTLDLEAEEVVGPRVAKS